MASQVVQWQRIHLPMQETWGRSLGWEDPQEERRQPTPVSLPGKSHGQRSLVGYSPWGHKRIRHDRATKQKNSNKEIIMMHDNHLETVSYYSKMND